MIEVNVNCAAGKKNLSFMYLKIHSIACPTPDANMLLVGLALECVSASRTVPPRSVGKPRNSFHARRFIGRGGIATNN
jgi:hypothetical protein